MTTIAAASPRQAGRKGVDWMARLGLAARGIVYLLVAWLAVRIAFAHEGAQADRQGALQQIAARPGGVAVLVAMAGGFAGYAAWRAIEALTGHRDDDGAKRTAKRLASAGRAALYAGFAVSAVRVAAGGSGGQGSDQTSRQATAGLLGQPLGRYLVIAGGAGFVVAGAVLAARGVMCTFDEHMKTGQMGRRTKAVVDGLGVAGQTARGVVFAMIGAFVIQAAVTFDAQKARGLDGALRTLAQSGVGKAGLVAVALGLAAFGFYSMAEARYRQT